MIINSDGPFEASIWIRCGWIILVSADGALEHGRSFLLGEACVHRAVVLGGFVKLTQLGDHLLNLVKISPHLRGKGIEILSVDCIIIIRILNHSWHISVSILQFSDCKKALRGTLSAMTIVVTSRILLAQRLVLVVMLERQVSRIKLPRDV